MSDEAGVGVGVNWLITFYSNLNTGDVGDVHRYLYGGAFLKICRYHQISESFVDHILLPSSWVFTNDRLYENAFQSPLAIDYESSICLPGRCSTSANDI